MKIYIASKYIKHRKINRELYNKILGLGIEAFLPESIDVNAITMKEMYHVSEICYEEINKCDIILIVCPFEHSVSSEIGFAISKKRENNKKKLLILNIGYKHNKWKKEAMIAPYIDEEFGKIHELMEYLSLQT